MSSSTDSPPFIVDSHIHLYDAGALDKLAWLKPGDPLYRPSTVGDYVRAVNGQPDGGGDSGGDSGPDSGPDSESGPPPPPPPGPRVGYIFIECDRKNGTDGDDWAGPLEEIADLRRLVEAEAEATAVASATASQARCLALVPWAPVHQGPAALARYLEQAEATAGPVVWPLVRGFRYLVQDKPHGTMLTDAFVDSLRLLGRRGFAFDLGIDQHRRGRTQMAEAVALVERLHGGAAADGTPVGDVDDVDNVDDDDKVVLVINHMAKPDITVLNPQADRGFAAWRDTMFALGKASPDHVFMKVSGLFTEMPPALRDQAPAAFFAATYPWLAVLLAAFGAPRLMFGSDWPVCTLPYCSSDAPETADAAGDAAGAETPAAPAAAPVRPRTEGEVGAWDKWRRIVAYMSYMATLSSDDVAMLWGGTAVKAYGLDKK